MPESPEIAALAKQARDGLDADELWAADGCSWRQVGTTGVIVASDGGFAEECASGNWSGVAEHIVRHDPHRVLADVAARRALLDEALGWEHQAGSEGYVGAPYRLCPGAGGGPCDCGRDTRVRAVLTALAAPYQETDRG